MKTNKTLIISITLIIFIITSLLAIYREGNTMGQLDILIILVTLIIGIIAIVKFRKKEKEQDEGQPEEDEFSLMLKYKTGYYSFLYSSYAWFLIFLLRGYFPDKVSIVGGGILISALIAALVKLSLKRKLNA